MARGIPSFLAPQVRRPAGQSRDCSTPSHNREGSPFLLPEPSERSGQAASGVALGVARAARRGAGRWLNHTAIYEPKCQRSSLIIACGWLGLSPCGLAAKPKNPSTGLCAFKNHRISLVGADLHRPRGHPSSSSMCGLEYDPLMLESDTLRRTTSDQKRRVLPVCADLHRPELSFPLCPWCLCGSSSSCMASNQQIVRPWARASAPTYPARPFQLPLCVGVAGGSIRAVCPAKNEGHVLRRA